MFSKNNKSNISRGTEIESYLLTATEKDAAKMEQPFEKGILRYFWLLMAAIMIIIAGRVVYLNVIKGQYYKEVSQGNRVRSIIIQAPRGKILDRRGEVLVNNVPSLDAVLIPVDLPADSNLGREIAETLAKILRADSLEIYDKLKNIDRTSEKPVLVKENISREQSLEIMENGRRLPGIAISKTAIRDYTDGFIFSHIIGYEGKINIQEMNDHPDYLMTDYIGKQGIEKSYEKELKGQNGAARMEVDSEGRAKRDLGTIEPKPGSDVVLSIDAKLQKKIFDELSLILEKTETRTAAALAMNPKNGEILAMVSLPSYDNNVFVRGLSGEDYRKIIADPDNPLFNRVTAGEYPPGSTIKPLIAAAALSEGVISPETRVDCSGAINIGSYQFRDWKTHGSIDLRSAIAESCDVYFYSLGGGYGKIAGLGMDKMKKYEELFGFGKVTGIDLPGETNGLVPSPSWKLEKFGEKWYIGNSYHAAIGQGYISVTPLQLLNYIAAVANGGTLYRPHIGVQIKKGEDIRSIPAQMLRDNFVSPNIIKIVGEGMRQTITGGTAQSLKDLPVEVAGKTGTAQFGAENKTHAWFVSYAPYENPEIAMVVLVEGGGEGHSSAVPVTKEVYQWYFSEGR